MKKILLVANVAKEHVIKFHIPTIKMLTENGYIVDVACSGDEKVPYCNKQYKLSYERASLNKNTFVGIKELKEIINNGNYDVVYCHTTVGGFAGRLASIKARKKGTKTIYLSHGYYFHKGAPTFDWLKFFTVEKVLAPITDCIIAINDEDFNIAKKRFRPNKIYQIPGIGVDYTKIPKVNENCDELRKQYREELNIPMDATVMIYLAELHDNKNQKFLIDVLKNLVDKYENAYLVLPGYDHADGEYQKYAEGIGVAEKVRFLGWRDDIGNLYNMADICTASSIREGFGINIVEAMAMGIPVVASNNRGHATIIKDGENGFLVEQNDIEGFAEKVKILIHNEEMKNKFIENGNKSKELYSSENVLLMLKNIFEEVLN